MAKLTMLKPRVATVDTRRVKPRHKVGLPFYSSPEWLALRDQVRREANGRCQRKGCGLHGRYVDHIVEIGDGGDRLNRRNCELLCASCHQIKTQQERAKRHGLR